MKIVNKLLFAFLILFVATSCCNDIEEDITITRDNSGKVKIKTVDSNNHPLDESVIEIYENNYQIMQGATDPNGIYDVGRLLQGNYYCNVVAKKGKSVYTIEKTIQIMAKDDFVLEINPLQNSGSFNVTVIDYETGSPILNPTDFRIALLVAPECYDVKDSVEFLLENAHFTASLDNNANALIHEIPLAKGYRFFLLNDKTNKIDTYIFYNIINKGETRNITIKKK